MVEECIAVATGQSTWLLNRCAEMCNTSLSAASPLPRDEVEGKGGEGVGKAPENEDSYVEHISGHLFGSLYT